MTDDLRGFFFRNVICKITTSRTNAIAKELLTFSFFEKTFQFLSLEHFRAYKYSIVPLI